MRVACDLVGRALGDLAAEVEHHDLVGDAHHHRHVVLDEQHGQVEVVAQPLTSSPSSSTSPWVRPLAGSSSISNFGSPASARASSMRLSVPNGSPAVGGWIGDDTTNAVNDVWFSTDGVVWQQQAEHAAWEPRSPVSVVFDDSIWIFSGKHTCAEDNWGGDLWQMASDG